MSKLKFDYLGKDYEAFRTEMINHIPQLLPEWTDYLQSDPGITLIELFSYGLDVLSYYQDRIANELYLPTAQLRQSVIDYAKPLGYKLREATPSKTYVVFEITPGESLTIPPGFRVTTKAEPGEEPVPFEIQHYLTIPAGDSGLEQENGEYIHKVEVVNGVTINNEVIGSSTGLPNQRFKLKYPNVTQIDDELIVQVDEGQGFVTWEKRDEIIDPSISVANRRFYSYETDADNYTWIKFGSGVDGKIPEEGVDNVRVTYRVGGGKDTRTGSNTITEIPVKINRVKGVFNPEPATGGEDRESIEEAKVKLPVTLYTRRRAVTLKDFKQIALLVDGVLKTTAVYEGETNTAHVSIIVKEGFDEDTIRENVYDFIGLRKLLGTNHTVTITDPLLLDLKITAYIGDEYEQEFIQTTVEEVLEDSFSKDIMNYNQDVRIFNIINALAGLTAVRNIEIDKLTIIPKIIEKDLSTDGELNIEEANTKSSDNTKGYWKIDMTSETDFTVYFDESGDFNGSEVSKGTGELGVHFTSSGDEIEFTVTGDNLSSGDFAVILAYAYKGDIQVGEEDIVIYGRSDITIEGGIESE